LATVICQYCRERFDRTKVEFVKKNSGYFHKTCFDKKQLEKSNDPRKGMLDFLNEVSGGKVNFALVQKQITEYVESGRYTISGLYGTLIYMVRIKKLKVDSKSGIALLPFLYNEAKDFWALQRALSESLKEIPEDEKIVKEVEVVVKPQETRKKENLIDIESMLEGVEDGRE